VIVLADKLREGLDQADRLLESLLVLARAQHGITGDQQTVSLGRVLAAVIKARGDAIAGLGLRVQQTTGGAWTGGDATLLSRMVDNVIDNAIRHNEPGGWIRAETGADGPTAHLVVESGRPVLDEDSVTGLAQPFRRLGADRTGSANGTGLGLSIVAAIAEAYGGSLRLHARPQGGLRDQGMAVDIAYDGVDAAFKIDVNSYDVLVLDRDLPGLHGDTICRMVTDNGNQVMVLMLTAADTPADRVAGLGLGADDYLPKPFHFPELVLRIRSLARRKPTAQARILRAAGIELDPLRRTVTRDGAEIVVSPKEFSVLEALMRAAPAVLSAESLLAQVWDENADPFTKTVQVTIGRLRRKLEDPQVIETIPSMGYRIAGIGRPR
jgi:DNA-binding response OmpR family regulator